MSWTDIFPVLDDEMLEAYREGVSEEELKQFDEWFGVDRVAGGHASRMSRQTGFQPVSLDLTAAETATGRDPYPPHIVYAILFWKLVHIADLESPTTPTDMNIPRRPAQYTCDQRRIDVMTPRIGRKGDVDGRCEIFRHKCFLRRKTIRHKT